MMKVFLLTEVPIKTLDSFFLIPSSVIKKLDQNDKACRADKGSKWYESNNKDYCILKINNINSALK